MSQGSGFHHKSYMTYIVLSSFSIVCHIYIFWFLLRYRRESGVIEFLWLNICSIEWILCLVLDKLLVPLSLGKVFIFSCYFGFNFVPVLLLFGALRLSGLLKKTPKKWFIAASVLPVLSILAAATNRYHRLWWKNSTTLHGSHSLTGPFYSIFALFCLICVVAAIAVFFTMCLRNTIARRQGIFFIIGIVVSWLTGVLPILKDNPFPDYFLLTIVSGPAMLVIIPAIKYAGMFHIPYIPHSDILSALSRGGYIVISYKNIILDADSVALNSLSLSKSCIGRNVKILWENFPELEELFNQSPREGYCTINGKLRCSLIMMPGDLARILQMEAITISEQIAPVTPSGTNTIALSSGSPEIAKEQNTILVNLISLFENENIFLNTSLDLAMVCKRLGTNRTHLSKMINDVLGISFNRLVNQYRIAEFMRLAQKTDLQVFSIDTLSREAGFKQRSTFYRSFIAVNGMSPGKWLKQCSTVDTSSNRIQNAS